VLKLFSLFNQGGSWKLDHSSQMVEQAMPARASYYRARYYDPSTGHFITEDPVRFYGAPNFYQYVRNNPALLIDPTGMFTRLPPDPGINTIVCNGRGGIDTQLGSPSG